MGAVILLSGPVGAGKTTVAKELIAISPGPVVYIEGDTFWRYIVKSGAGHNIHTNFRMIMTAMVAAARPMAAYGYEVIVDFSFPPWFLDTARKVIKEKAPLHYIVIRPSEKVCMERAAARSEGAIPGYSRYHDLYTLFDQAQCYIIADETASPAIIAKYVREAIDGGMFVV